MPTPALLTRPDLIDHDTCPPRAHVTAARPDRGEDADEHGQLVCLHCGGSLLRCLYAAAANRRAGGYQRVYVHIDPTLEGTCR